MSFTIISLGGIFMAEQSFITQVPSNIEDLKKK